MHMELFLYAQYCLPLKWQLYTQGKMLCKDLSLKMNQSLGRDVLSLYHIGEVIHNVKISSDTASSLFSVFIFEEKLLLVMQIL